MKKIVSVLTPCYNNANIIHHLLDSVLMQSYPHIEMIVVDDGSSDNLELVITNYSLMFKDKGYILKYYKQLNQGQSVAIKNGLKLITGDYLVWPDADDCYSDKDAISTMVDAFQNNGDDIGLVRCCGNFVDENTYLPIGDYGMSRKYSENQFENCLFGKNFWFVPGDYMLKVSTFFKNVPNGDIFTHKNTGQNWQIMLPMLYKQRCITIQKRMYNICVRRNSHSRSNNNISYNDRISRCCIFEETILQTLNRMKAIQDVERDAYKKDVVGLYLKNKVRIAAEYMKGEDLYKYKELMYDSNVRIDALTFIAAYFPRFYSIFKHMQRKIK